MDFSKNTQGSTVPFFGISTTNLINNEPSLPVKPFESYRVTYFSYDPRPFPSIIPSAASFNQPHEEDNTALPPINTTSRTPTVSLLQAEADKKWTEYAVSEGKRREEKRNSPKEKIQPKQNKKPKRAKNWSIFSYNTAPEAQKHALPANQGTLRRVNMHQEQTESEVKIQTKLIIYTPEGYKDKSSDWKQRANVSPFKHHKLA